MSGYCKYYKQKKQVSYDSGATWQDVTPYEYRQGDLYEPNSTDCGYVAKFERWVESGTTCEGTSLYKVEVLQTSSDGINWVTKDETRLGDLIETESSQCTDLYRWVETDEFGCHKANMPLGNYKICGYRYHTSGTTILDSLEWFEVPCDFYRILRQNDCDNGQGWVDVLDTAFWDLGGAYSADNIETAYIGECVTQIGGTWYPFGSIDVRNCRRNYPDMSINRLKTVIMADSVVLIGPYAFVCCNSLESIELSETLKTISHDAFNSCHSLASIDLPASLETIGDYAFIDCSGLTTVTIPENVKTIGYCAFEEANGIETIHINTSGLTTWSGACFNMRGLERAYLSTTITEIPDHAFNGCSSLTAITYLTNLTSIGDYAFRGCESLTSFTIPSGVTSLGNKVFHSCTGLTELTVEATTPPIFKTAGLNALGDYLDSLTTIYVPMQSVNLYKQSWADYSELIVGKNM
jgi:hypothetical protein